MLYTQQDISNFSEQSFAYLIVEEKENVLTITLNRPEKRNAFHMPLANELAYALAYAHYTNAVWCVVLKANGPTFCAGADLKAFAGDDTTEKPSTIPMPKDMVKLGDEFNGLHKPCIGIFPFQVMATLEPLMSARQLLDLCLRAKTLTAQEAKEIGLVSFVVKTEELESTVQQLVADIKEQSPTALRLGLKAFQEMKSKSSDDKHKYLHAMLMQCLQSKDAAEGLLAFKEKRKANWTGN